MITCLQVHNDYLIPGGETKSAKLIADLLEENGIKVIRYYKSNEKLKSAGKLEKITAGIKSLYNYDTAVEVSKIIEENHIDFALIHNVSPIISNSIYSVLIKNNIRIYKYLQNYNLLCLNGAMDQGEKCELCAKRSAIGVRSKCYKSSAVYSLQKLITKKILWKKYLDSFYGFIAISSFVKKKHVAFGIPEDKIHVLYHFCEENAQIIRSGNDDRYVVYLGRLSKEKGIMTLIHAMKNNPEIELKIMGNGPMEQELQQYVCENKMSNIQFLGFKSGEEKNQIIANAIALVAPSEWEEPFGRIAIEAYQVGTPVIASAIGGLNELVEDGVTGYKFEAGNVENLSKCISAIAMLSSHELDLMRSECVQLVNRKFSKKAYFDDLAKIMEWENCS